MKDENENVTNLLTYEPSDGRNTLGVTLAPDGNNKKAIEELREKTLKWKNLILSGHLRERDARLALHSTIYQYSLPALTLTESECK